MKTGLPIINSGSFLFSADEKEMTNDECQMTKEMTKPETDRTHGFPRAVQAND